MMHNRLFAQCRVLDNFREVIRSKDKNLRPRTRTRKVILEDSLGQQHWFLAIGSTTGKVRPQGVQLSATLPSAFS